jgi:hypothetical protein
LSAWTTLTEIFQGFPLVFQAVQGW